MNRILDVEPEIEPEIEPEPEPEPAQEPEPEPEPPAPAAAVVSFPVAQLLPADFPLPALVRFVPNAALRRAVVDAATYALSIDVTGPDGLQRADVAVSALRSAMKAWEEPFTEPTSLANQLHKHLTGARGDGLEPGVGAIRTVGARMVTEKNRLDAIEREARRKAQEEADRVAREAAKREAEAAAKAHAPAPVVEQLRQRAETATAPPVPVTAPAPKLQGSSVVSTWKARIAGTPACDEPLPDTEKLSPAQQLEVLKLLKAIVDGRAPMAAICLNTSYLDRRAKADKSTLLIPGIEAYEIGSVRAKATRTK